MKTYAVIGGVILAGALGVLTFADLPATAPLAEAVPSVDDPRWVPYENEFTASLDSDPAYQAAFQAESSYTGDDPEELHRLAAQREARYYELAGALYEKHFGAWIGGELTPFPAFIDEVLKDIHRVCSLEARESCGKGNICWVDSTETRCRYACKINGEPCAPMPTD